MSLFVDGIDASADLVAFGELRLVGDDDVSDNESYKYWRRMGPFQVVR